MKDLKIPFAIVSFLLVQGAGEYGGLLKLTVE